MKKLMNLWVFTMILLSTNTYSMELNFPAKMTSKFLDRMINTTTYDYKSREHIASMACVFALPQPIGQYILYRQRSNMKKFLKENEANNLENVRQHYNVDPEKWQTVFEKARADHEFNLKAMREPGNNYNTYHDPNLPKEWVDAINNECKRHGFNKNNLNLTFEKPATEELKNIALARTEPRSSNGSYTPATVKLTNHPFSVGLVQLQWQTAAHEMTHVTQGHSLYSGAVGNAIQEPVPAVPDGPYWYDYLFPSTINKHINTREEIIKINTKNLEIITNLTQEPAYQKYIAAVEKTADTLLCCDDPIVAKEYLHKEHILNYNGTTAYPENTNDIAVLNANWKTAQAITDSRIALNNIIQLPRKLSFQLLNKLFYTSKKHNLYSIKNKH